jgi:hypothetical protein
MPVLLADYLVLHFALFGALLWLVGRQAPAGGASAPTYSVGAASAATAAVTLYALFAFGIPTDRYGAVFFPTVERLPYVAVIFLGMLPFFVAVEWLTRGVGATRWGYGVTMLAFVISLLIAVALNPERLFFLLIILPAMALFFVVYGLLSRWTFQATGDPRVAAIANAVVFAVAVAVTFPLTGR